mgnify:CR=1 FL=1
MNESVSKKAWNILTILAGNAIYALGVAVFILPNDLITGGTTGLGIAFEHYFGYSRFPLLSFASMPSCSFLGRRSGKDVRSDHTHQQFLLPDHPRCI